MSPKPKHFPESKSVFGFGDVFWVITRAFGFSDRSVLDSGKCFGLWNVFWILRSVFGFWTCFEFWTCFWNLGSVSDFVKSFWILERVLDSGKCFWILGRVLFQRATVCLWLVEENIFRGMICQKYYLDHGGDKTSVWNSCALSSEVMRGERPLIQVDGFLFFFLSIVRSCLPLLPPSNGAFVGVCNSKYNSVCRIQCNEGYEVSGSAERKCIVVAGPNVMDWSGPPSQCQGGIKTSD